MITLLHWSPSGIQLLDLQWAQIQIAQIACFQQPALGKAFREKQLLKIFLNKLRNVKCTECSNSSSPFSLPCFLYEINNPEYSLTENQVSFLHVHQEQFLSGFSFGKCLLAGLCKFFGTSFQLCVFAVYSIVESWLVTLAIYLIKNVIASTRNIIY